MPAFPSLSLRAKRSNPAPPARTDWIASAPNAPRNDAAEAPKSAQPTGTLRSILVSALRIAPIAIVLLASTAHAFPGERDKLNVCQALADRAARAQQAGTALNAADDAELQKCRQIIKEWTLRDSRMSVDEQGRPLR